MSTARPSFRAATAATASVTATTSPDAECLRGSPRCRVPPSRMEGMRRMEMRPGRRRTMPWRPRTPRSSPLAAAWTAIPFEGEARRGREFLGGVAPPLPGGAIPPADDPDEPLPCHRAHVLRGALDGHPELRSEVPEALCAPSRELEEDQESRGAPEVPPDARPAPHGTLKRASSIYLQVFWIPLK